MAGDNGQVASGSGGGGFPARAILTRLAVAVVIIAAVVVVGCGELNRVPTINSPLLANPDTVVQDGSSTISCNATDPDGDTITYSWSATGGTFSGVGKIVTWEAPHAVGTYTITVTADDGKGGTATDGVVVTVIVGNSPPVIASVVAADPSVNPSGSTTVTCTATDADGDTLTYTWSAPDGGSISGSGDSVTWHAPAAEDTYAVEVTVSDGQGGTDSGSTNIVVVFVATTGSIYIQSIPVGAKVYLDGVDTGSVTGAMGYTINDVSAGSHTVKLRYDYYKDMQGTVMVPAGGTVPISWDLTTNSAVSLVEVIQPDAQDAYVYEMFPDSNLGSSEHVVVHGTGATTQCYTYIQFDLSSLPATAVVTQARLGLYYYLNGGGSTAGPAGVYVVTSPWDESTITWNLRPSSGVTPVTTVTLPAAATNNFRYCYITDTVKGWWAGSIANRGVMLKDTDEATFEGYKYFRTSEWGTAAQRPILEVTYYDPVP